MDSTIEDSQLDMDSSSAVINTSLVVKKGKEAFRITRIIAITVAVIILIFSAISNIYAIDFQKTRGKFEDEHIGILNTEVYANLVFLADTYNLDIDTIKFQGINRIKTSIAPKNSIVYTVDVVDGNHHSEQGNKISETITVVFLVVEHLKFDFNYKYTIISYETSDAKIAITDAVEKLAVALERGQ